MDRVKIEEAAKELMAQQLDIDAEQVVPSAEVISDLGADSLDMVELILALEEEFEIEISDDDAEKLTSVGQIYDYLDERLKDRK